MASCLIKFCKITIMKLKKQSKTLKISSNLNLAYIILILHNIIRMFCIIIKGFISIYRLSEKVKNFLK